MLGDFRGEYIFGLYRMGTYTTKNQGMIENKSIKKNQIIEKLWMPLEAIRNVSQSEPRNKGHAPIRLPALPAGYHRLIPGGARQLMLAVWPARARAARPHVRPRGRWRPEHDEEPDSDGGALRIPNLRRDISEHDGERSQ